MLVYFAKDIFNIAKAWLQGVWEAITDKLRHHGERTFRSAFDYRMGWMVIVGTLPVAILGYLGKDYIRDALRNLWITAAMLILFSFVFIIAEKVGRRQRSFEELTMKDAVFMGFAQCLALIPGVSRSGGTVSAGLFLNLDREVATRFSFLLAIPAVLASGLFSLPDAFNPEAGQAASGAQLFVGTAIAFVVGYISIAWLLRFVANHSFAWFALWRIPVGVAVMALLAFGVLQP